MDELIETINVSLFVDDYDKAIEFYCDRTGLFKVYAENVFNESYRFLVLIYHNSKFPFALDIEIATNEEEELFVGKQGGKWSFLALPVDDCWKMYKELSTKGVKFISEPSETPTNIVATCYDPFGNKISLVEAFN